MKSDLVKKLIQTARGETRAEVVFKNGSIVNGISGEILDGDIALCNGQIVGVSYHN